MTIIDRAGQRVRNVCGYCHKPRTEGHYATRGRRDWVCDECFASVAAQCVEGFLERQKRGIPEDRQYFDIPERFITFIDNRWRAALARAIGKYAEADLLESGGATA